MHQNDCNQHNGKHRSVADPDIQLEGPHHVADPDIWLETNNVSLYISCLLLLSRRSKPIAKLDGEPFPPGSATGTT